MDELSREIATYNWFPGQMYAEGAHQVTPSFGPWDASQWMEIPSIPIQTCFVNVTIEAPTPYQASIITHPVPLSYRSHATVIGQAPQTGVYTGVEDRTC
jgi:hypothetical protein